MVTREHVRPKVHTGDGLASGELNGSPPVGVDQHLVVQPVRDELLARGRAPELPQFVGEGALATSSNVDSAPQRDNVRFLHGSEKYTNRFVKSTTRFVGQVNKEACNVLAMPVRKPQPAPASAKRRKAVPGADGKTLGQRVNEAMAHEAGRRGREYRQSDVLSDVNHLAGRWSDNPLVTQQMLSAIMLGTVSRSSVTAFIAAACHVNPLWLGQGVGKMIE